MITKKILLLLLCCTFLGSLTAQQVTPVLDFSALDQQIRSSALSIKLQNSIIRKKLVLRSDTVKTKVAFLKQTNADFQMYIKRIKKELITRGGGPDPNYDNGQPIQIRDKTIATQYFITEGHGKELKSKIDSTRQQILTFIPAEFRLEFEKMVPLTTVERLPATKNMTWESFKFKEMPLAAVLPILSKYMSDAAYSERLVLEYLDLSSRR